MYIFYCNVSDILYPSSCLLNPYTCGILITEISNNHHYHRSDNKNIADFLSSNIKLLRKRDGWRPIICEIVYYFTRWDNTNVKWCVVNRIPRYSTVYTLIIWSQCLLRLFSLSLGCRFFYTHKNACSIPCVFM